MRDSFAIAMMFVRLSVRVFVSWMGVYYDHTVHFSADLSLCLVSPMFLGTLTPKHVHLSYCTTKCYSSSTWKRREVWMCKLGVIFQERLMIEVKLLLGANKKSYILR